MRCFLLPVLHHKPIPTGQSHHRPRWASPPELPPGHSTPKFPPGTGLAQHPAKPTAERARRSCTASVPSGACCVQKRLKKRKKERKKKGEWVEIITSTVRPRVAAGRSPSGRGLPRSCDTQRFLFDARGRNRRGGEALGAQIGTFLRGRKPRGGEQTKAELRDLDAAPRVTAPAGSGCRRPPGTTPGGCSPPVRPRSVHTGGNPVPVPLSEPPLLPAASRRGFSFKQIGKKQRKWGGKGNVSAARCYRTDPGGPRGREGSRRPLAGMGAPGRAPVPPQPGHRGQERGVGSAYRGLKKEPGPPAG